MSTPQAACQANLVRWQDVLENCPSRTYLPGYVLDTEHGS